jgi:hypothetical protein
MTGERTEMTEHENAFDVFDPTGMFKTLRQDQMDAWAKMMVQFVNTDAYADATGKLLSDCLSTSAPLRELVEKTMKQSLTNLSMPTRDDIIRLAERLTNIEMRLDDMDAKLDQLTDLPRRSTAAKKT